MLLQYEGDCAVEEQSFMEAIWAALYKLYGEYGASLASLALINFDSAAKMAVIRTNLAVADNVRTSIASITSILGKPAAIHIAAVSGTIKGLHEENST